MSMLTENPKRLTAAIADKGRVERVGLQLEPAMLILAGISFSFSRWIPAPKLKLVLPNSNSSFELELGPWAR